LVTTACCMCCFDKARHQINNKIVRVNEAPNPSNINWTHLSYGSTAKSIRYAFSMLMVSILLAFGKFFYKT